MDLEQLIEGLLSEARTIGHTPKVTDYPTAAQILNLDQESQRIMLLAALDWDKHRDSCDSRELCAIGDLRNKLLERALPLQEADLLQMLDFWSESSYWPLGLVLKATHRYVGEHGMSDSLRTQLDRTKAHVQQSYMGKEEFAKLRKQLGELLGEEGEDIRLQHLDLNEPWTAQLIEDLEALPADLAPVIREMIVLADTADGGKPKAMWFRKAKAHLEEVDKDHFSRLLCRWLALFDKPRDREPEQRWLDSVWHVVNDDLLKGLIWFGSQLTDRRLIRAIGAAGLSGQRKIPGVGPRANKVTNAAVWALGQIDDPAAIGQLAILRARIKNKTTQKGIDKAIDVIAERLGVPATEVEEMSVPTYGLTEPGFARVVLGDFTAELVVTGTASVELRWFKPDGKPQKTVPKAVKDDHADELKELKASQKDIKKMLPAQRDRIDLLHTQQRRWTYDIWRERYLDHPLCGALARRLIWSLHRKSNAQVTACSWLNNSTEDGLEGGSEAQPQGRLVDVDGAPIADPKPADEISLWHPIGHEVQEITAWRRFFEDREIRQPFKQAHREVYLLTDAERTTRIYSNRYAAHVLRQHQFKALAEQRGWRYALQGAYDSPDEVATRELPEHGIKAEFWVERPWTDAEDEWNESGIFFRVVTDQVRFYPLESEGRDTWHNRGTVAEDGIPLEDIDPLVLSEIMRDVDLFVGVASIGNDPTWQDGGPEGRYLDYWQGYSFGDLTPTAETRKEILERLIPRLKIADRCSFESKFLVVRGDRRTYKIHLGSSNILMEPNDQYLCIVPGRSSAAQDKLFLPFEGDARLSVILSKALLLADDTKIKDETILSQL